MNEISYNYGVTMTDVALLKLIGSFIKHHRLKNNITQQQLSKDSGISRSTLSLLEKGEIVTVATLIRVLRVLDLLYVITDTFKVNEEVSPVQYAKLYKREKKRVRNTDPDILEEPDLGW